MVLATVILKESNAPAENVNAITNLNFGSFDGYNLNITQYPLFPLTWAFQKWVRLHVSSNGSGNIIDNFKVWISHQESSGKKFTEEQRQWLVMIRDHIAANLGIDTEDFDFIIANIISLLEESTLDETYLINKIKDYSRFAKIDPNIIDICTQII